MKNNYNKPAVLVVEIEEQHICAASSDFEGKTIQGNNSSATSGDIEFDASQYRNNLWE